MNITYLFCKKCKDSVFSFYRHDMNWCKCGSCALDGGFDYIRGTGNHGDYAIIESDISSIIKIIRKKFKWTQRYDKNKRILKTPITKTLNKLTSEHIINILLCLIIINKSNINTENDKYTISKELLIIQEIFLEELKYRKLK